ncbi:MAG: hypothetical protein GYB65_22550 [Chloroflexi bacterium]|nr:hypothetical protein [Chloroflexota bacterium]
MRTPAGKECLHYYQDFHRGRSTQECRLVKDNPDSMPWRSRDCYKCPVPDILRANASDTMVLKLTIRPALLGFVRQYKVEAWCERHDIPIKDPYVGCPLDAEENPALQLFRDALEDSDDD